MFEKLICFRVSFLEMILVIIPYWLLDKAERGNISSNAPGFIPKEDCQLVDESCFKFFLQTLGQLVILGGSLVSSHQLLI